MAYRAELDRLSQVGLRRGFGESREAFAARLHALAPSFAALTERHLGARFGTRREADRGALRDLSSAIGSELGRAVPLWRRALGALNPVSWLWSR